jgi:NADPH2:quinone reductase
VEAIALPANLTFAEGAAIPIPFYTAYRALHHKRWSRAEKPCWSPLAAVESVLQRSNSLNLPAQESSHGGLTRKSGADTRSGDVAINYREQDFAAEVQRLTDGKGVDVIIENVASDNLAKDLAIAARDSRIIVIGTGTGKGPDGHFAVMHALMKDVNILGMSLVNAGAFIAEMATALTGMFVAGKLKAIVSKSYPLPEAQQALADLVAGRVFGKLVLTP